LFTVEANLRNVAAKYNGTPPLTKIDDRWVYGEENKN